MIFPTDSSLVFCPLTTQTGPWMVISEGTSFEKQKKVQPITNQITQEILFILRTHCFRITSEALVSQNVALICKVSET